jgi:CPA2 family monovalent cation:H+ antiporter-2
MTEVEPLVRVGADEVVPEEFVGAIEIFSRVLERYLTPQETIKSAVDEARSESARWCEKLFTTHRPGEGLQCVPCNLTIEVHRVEPGCSVAGKRLHDCHLRSTTGTSVVAIRRQDGTTVVNPRATDTIAEGDAVVLLGRADQLAGAAPLFKSAETPDGPGT